jgi:tetrapyrrole methylase family protein/MazG family protein
MDAQVSHDWNGLRQLCARLRAPGGCPWDRAQSIRTLTPYLLEETHELLDAITAGEDGRIAEEIGDLLYLLISILTIAEEEGRFTFATVAGQTAGKLVRRHPQVFGPTAPPTAPPTDAAGARQSWETIKQREAEGRPGKRTPLPSGSERLPALLEAFRVQEKAAGFGFDWTAADPVLVKLDEERRELAEAMMAGSGEEHRAAVREELGDVLFTVVNLARHLGEDPERALHGAVGKFRTRFGRMERLLERQGLTLGEADLAAMEAAWDLAKTVESSPSAPAETERHNRSS